MSGATRGEAIAAAAARLAAAGVEDPARDARLLYRWAAGLSGAALAAGQGEPAGAAELAAFGPAVARRAERVPLAQITGRRAFWGREFRVTADVLDPRPETETLIAAALEGPPAARVLDLGTGSGCLLLTLLAEWPGATGLGIDASPAALAVAAGNAADLGLAARAEFRPGDWLTGIGERFDLIAANPPYIPEADLAALAPEVRLHEPRMALTPGTDASGDGLGAYRAIAPRLSAVLAPGGRFLAEFGAGQGAAVQAIFAAAGHHGILRADLDGRPRCISVTA